MDGEVGGGVDVKLGGYEARSARGLKPQRLNIATRLSCEPCSTLFVAFPPVFASQSRLQQQLDIPLRRGHSNADDCGREESQRSYLHSASRPQRRVCRDRWYTSVMCLGSREPGGGEEWRKKIHKQLTWPCSASRTLFGSRFVSDACFELANF